MNPNRPPVIQDFSFVPGYISLSHLSPVLTCSQQPLPRMHFVKLPAANNQKDPVWIVTLTASSRASMGFQRCTKARSFMIWRLYLYGCIKHTECVYRDPDLQLRSTKPTVITCTSCCSLHDDPSPRPLSRRKKRAGVIHTFCPGGPWRRGLPAAPDCWYLKPGKSPPPAAGCRAAEIDLSHPIMMRLTCRQDGSALGSEELWSKGKMYIP